MRANKSLSIIMALPVVVIQRFAGFYTPMMDPTIVVVSGDEKEMDVNGTVFKTVKIKFNKLRQEDDVPKPTSSDTKDSTVGRVNDENIRAILPVVEIGIPPSKSKLKVTKEMFYSEAGTEEVSSRVDILETEPYIIPRLSIEQQAEMLPYFFISIMKEGIDLINVSSVFEEVHDDCESMRELSSEKENVPKDTSKKTPQKLTTKRGEIEQSQSDRATDDQENSKAKCEGAKTFSEAESKHSRLSSITSNNKSPVEVTQVDVDVFAGTGNSPKSSMSIPQNQYLTGSTSDQCDDTEPQILTKSQRKRQRKAARKLQKRANKKKQEESAEREVDEKDENEEMVEGIGKDENDEIIVGGDENDEIEKKDERYDEEESQEYEKTDEKDESKEKETDQNEEIEEEKSAENIYSCCNNISEDESSLSLSPRKSNIDENLIQEKSESTNSTECKINRQHVASEITNLSNPVHGAAQNHIAGDDNGMPGRSTKGKIKKHPKRQTNRAKKKSKRQAAAKGLSKKQATEREPMKPTSPDKDKAEKLLNDDEPIHPTSPDIDRTNKQATESEHVHPTSPDESKAKNRLTDSEPIYSTRQDEDKAKKQPIESESMHPTSSDEGKAKKQLNEREPMHCTSPDEDRTNKQPTESEPIHPTSPVESKAKKQPTDSEPIHSTGPDKDKTKQQPIEGEQIHPSSPGESNAKHQQTDNEPIHSTSYDEYKAKKQPIECEPIQPARKNNEVNKMLIQGTAGQITTPEKNSVITTSRQTERCLSSSPDISQTNRILTKEKVKESSILSKTDKAGQGKSDVVENTTKTDGANESANQNKHQTNKRSCAERIKQSFSILGNLDKKKESKNEVDNDSKLKEKKSKEICIPSTENDSKEKTIDDNLTEDKLTKERGGKHEILSESLHCIKSDVNDAKENEKKTEEEIEQLIQLLDKYRKKRLFEGETHIGLPIYSKLDTKTAAQVSNKTAKESENTHSLNQDSCLENESTRLLSGPGQKDILKSDKVRPINEKGQESSVNDNTKGKKITITPISRQRLKFNKTPSKPEAKIAVMVSNKTVKVSKNAHPWDQDSRPLSWQHLNFSKSHLFLNIIDPLPVSILQHNKKEENHFQMVHGKCEIDTQSIAMAFGNKILKDESVQNASNCSAEVLTGEVRNSFLNSNTSLKKERHNYEITIQQALSWMPLVERGDEKSSYKWSIVKSTKFNTSCKNFENSNNESSAKDPQSSPLLRMGNLPAIGSEVKRAMYSSSVMNVGKSQSTIHSEIITSAKFTAKCEAKAAATLAGNTAGNPTTEALSKSNGDNSNSLPENCQREDNEEQANKQDDSFKSTEQHSKMSKRIRIADRLRRIAAPPRLVQRGFDSDDDVSNDSSVNSRKITDISVSQSDMSSVMFGQIEPQSNQVNDQLTNRGNEYLTHSVTKDDAQNMSADNPGKTKEDVNNNQLNSLSSEETRPTTQLTEKYKQKLDFEGKTCYGKQLNNKLDINLLCQKIAELTKVKSDKLPDHTSDKMTSENNVNTNIQKKSNSTKELDMANIAQSVRNQDKMITFEQNKSAEDLSYIHIPSKYSQMEKIVQLTTLSEEDNSDIVNQLHDNGHLLICNLLAKLTPKNNINPLAKTTSESTMNANISKDSNDTGNSKGELDMKRIAQSVRNRDEIITFEYKKGSKDLSNIRRPPKYIQKRRKLLLTTISKEDQLDIANQTNEIIQQRQMSNQTNEIVQPQQRPITGNVNYNTSRKVCSKKPTINPLGVKNPGFEWNVKACRNILLQHTGLSFYDKDLWRTDVDVVGDPIAVISKPMFLYTKNISGKAYSSSNKMEDHETMVSINNGNDQIIKKCTSDELDEEYISVINRLNWCSRMSDDLEIKFHLRLHDARYRNNDLRMRLKKETAALHIRKKEIERQYI